MLKSLRFAIVAASASLVAAPALAADSPVVGTWNTEAVTDFGTFRSTMTVAEAGGVEHAAKLAGAVDGVGEREGLVLSVVEDVPGVFDALPTRQDGAAFEHHSPVSARRARHRRKDTRQSLLVHQVHGQPTTGTEASAHVRKHAQIVVRGVEVAERREHAQRQVERVGPDEIAHVGLHPLDLEPGGARPCLRLVQEVLRAIDARHAEALAGQCQGAASRSAAEVERGRPWRRRERDDLIHLLDRLHEAGLREQERRHVLPEGVIVEPFAAAAGTHRGWSLGG